MLIVSVAIKEVAEMGEGNAGECCAGDKSNGLDVHRAKLMSLSDAQSGETGSEMRSGAQYVCGRSYKFFICILSLCLLCV